MKKSDYDRLMSNDGNERVYQTMFDEKKNKLYAEDDFSEEDLDDFDDVDVVEMDTSIDFDEAIDEDLIIFDEKEVERFLAGNESFDDSLKKSFKKEDDRKSALRIWNSLPPKLDKDETIRLIKEFKETGDTKARDKVVYGNMRLVATFVNKAVSSGFFVPSVSFDWEDAFQEGIFTIQKAVNKFDYEKYEFQFSTFAWRCLDRRFKQIKSYDIRQKRQSNHNAISLDEPLKNNKQDESETTRLDMLADSRAITEGQLVDKMEFDRIKNEILPLFPKREQELIEHYFIEEMTMEDVALVMNCSRQYVYLLLDSVMTKLENLMKEGVTQTDVDLRRIELQNNKSRKVYERNNKVIIEFRKVFGLDGILQFKNSLPQGQRDVFEKMLYNPISLVGMDRQQVQGIIIKKMEIALQRGKIIAEKIKPLSQRQIQAVNRNERLIEEFGGRAFLAKYFLPNLPEREQKVFTFAILQFEGQSKADLAKICGISPQNFQMAYSKVLDKLASTDFELLVSMVDNAERFGGSVSNINISKLDAMKERQEFVEKHGGVLKLRKLFMPILSGTQKLVFEKLYLSPQYDSISAMAEKEGLGAPNIVTAEKILREKLEATNIEELAMIQERAENLARGLFADKRINTKMKASLRKREEFVARNGGKEFLLEMFASKLEVPAHKTVFVEYVLNGLPATKVGRLLNLKETSGPSYVDKITKMLYAQIEEWKQTFPDFEKEVESFYARKEFGKKHSEDFEKNALGEYQFVDDESEPEELSIETVGRCKDFSKRDEFIKNFLKQFGSPTEIVRDFLPTVKKVADKQVFVKFFLESKSNREIRSEVGLKTYELIASKNKLIAGLEEYANRRRKYYKSANRISKNKYLQARRIGDGGNSEKKNTSNLKQNPNRNK